MLHKIEHRSVVVLMGSKSKVLAEPVVVEDAGHTEVTPGTATCGTHFEPEPVRAAP